MTAVQSAPSIVANLLTLPEKQRKVFVETLSDDEIRWLLYDWEEWGRPNQQTPPGDWVIWLILAGRGWGKTRTGVEWIRSKIEPSPFPLELALIAETKRDGREVIVHGPAGFIQSCPPWNMPKWESSKPALTWPNGSVGHLYSGEEPDQLRGPSFHFAWVDEWAKYQYPVETMDNLELALRLGDHPQMIITTTPRPLPMLKEKLSDPDVVLTRGHTDENRANLAASYIKRVIKKYEGTRLGRQELAGDILEDVEGGFWTRALMDTHRLPKDARLPEMVRIAIAIDPAASTGEHANETGMFAGGVGTDGICYIFHDLSGIFEPEQWGNRAIRNYDRFHADAIIGERNNGGDLVERNVRACEGGQRVNFRTVWASRGKHIRAEPVATKHQQGKIKFVGSFAAMEDQLIFFTPEGYEGVGSPDRAEAFIWLVWFLLRLSSKGDSDYDADEWADSSV